MPAASREIRYWIDTALECARRDHTPAFGEGDQRGPFMTARALGMALGALHDGHALGGAQQLLPLTLAAPAPGLNAAVTGAAACHQLLLHRYPSQSRSLNAAWRFWTELYRLGDGASEAHGRAVGDAIDRLGLGDLQRGAAVDYAPHGDYTHDKPAHEPNQSFAGSVWGTTEPLIAGRVSGFAPPPGRKGPVVVIPDAHFADDFRLVQSKGASQARARTADEELIGIFWGYDGPPELGTPPRLYLQVALSVLDEIDARAPAAMAPDEALRLIAAIGLTMADAGIEAWRYKYSADHMMWRPVLGIAHGLSGLVPAEPGWLPLGRPDTNGTGENLTPDFPAYPSGHATFGAAAFQLLRVYLVHKGLATFDADGLDDIRFCCSSDEYNGRNRDPRPPRWPRPKLLKAYTNLWSAVVDNSVSRVYLGVHWQFDGITRRGPADADGESGLPRTPAELGRRGGVWLGCQLANRVALKLGVPPETVIASRA